MIYLHGRINGISTCKKMGYHNINLWYPNRL